jgi:hypothetical protein
LCAHHKISHLAVQLPSDLVLCPRYVLIDTVGRDLVTPVIFSVLFWNKVYRIEHANRR